MPIGGCSGKFYTGDALRHGDDVACDLNWCRQIGRMQSLPVPSAEEDHLELVGKPAV